MTFLAYLVALLIVGLIVGALARLALPGRDPMSIGQTIAVGVGGSFLAGIAAELLVGRPAGFLLCLVFSAGIVYFIRRSRGGGLTDPGVPPPNH